MTFPFSGEFKFNLLKAKREDDMTSSTIKNLNGDLHLNYFAFLFVFFVQEVPGNNFLQARKRGGI